MFANQNIFTVSATVLSDPGDQWLGTGPGRNEYFNRHLISFSNLLNIAGFRFRGTYAAHIGLISVNYESRALPSATKVRVNFEHIQDDDITVVFETIDRDPTRSIVYAEASILLIGAKA